MLSGEFPATVRRPAAPTRRRRSASQAERAPVRLPLHLQWHQRQVHSPAPGVVRITVPLRGGPPPRQASRRLTEDLDHRWVGRVGTVQLGITSVVAELRHADDAELHHGHRLTLLITTNGAAAHHPEQSAQMARHLRLALEALGPSATGHGRE